MQAGRQTVSVVLWAALSGCATTAPETPPGPDTAAAHADYRAAITDAAVIEAAEIQPLPVINAPVATVVTWTEFADGYPPGADITLERGDVWVTLEGAVQTRCQAFAPRMRMLNLQQLLGLPPKDNDQRKFVTLAVNTDDMFRPCADPSLANSRCHADFPAEVSDEYRTWFANRSAMSYQSPNGYPWTRLGYTFNWNPAADKVGPAEFVVRNRATATVLAVQDTDDYCAGARVAGSATSL